MGRQALPPGPVFVAGVEGAVTLPRLSGIANASYRRCVSCGARHAVRERMPGTCLTCDIRQRSGAGESADAIAFRFELPPFLVAAVIEGAT